MNSPRSDSGSSPESFATTRWSLVLAAGHAPAEEAARALAGLCGTYWYPLYVYVRRRGNSEHAAQDLTQAFIAHLLSRQALAAATPERGRFRAFLLTALKNFLTNEHERAQALKRGGGLAPLALDFESGESRYRQEPFHEDTPERIFERQWALTLLERVTGRLESEFREAGKERTFSLLKEFLAGASANHSYTAVAAELETSEDAARQAAHRLRKRYRELLREEVAETLADPAEADDELRRLVALF